MTYRHITAGLLALVLLTAAGCGSDDNNPPASGASGAARTATPALDGEQQGALDRIRQDFTAYCKTKRNEPVGSAAIAESLLEFGPDLRTRSGSTLGEEIARSRDELKACGATKLAKRLTAALR